jgi:hypothetical protein
VEQLDSPIDQRNLLSSIVMNKYTVILALVAGRIGFPNIENFDREARPASVA